MDLSKIFELKRENLSFFGWLSITLTIISIPFFVISFIVGFANPQQTTNPLVSLLTILYTLVYVSIFYFFKVLLNKKYKFMKADKAISVFIYLNIIVTVLAEVLNYVQGAETINTIVIFGSLIPFGIVSIVLGVKLLSLGNPLFGMKKSLSINLIASGILYASIILFLIAIVPSLIVTALLGVIFLREAAVLESKTGN